MRNILLLSFLTLACTSMKVSVYKPANHIVAHRGAFKKNGFPGDETPIIRGSATKALAATSMDDPAVKPIVELLDACDNYIPEPVRELDKPFAMAIEDVAFEWCYGCISICRFISSRC